METFGSFYRAHKDKLFGYLMRLSGDYQLACDETVIDAVEADLPATPVMNKVREGIAKNIPEEKVVQAMTRTRARYALAYGYAREKRMFVKNAPDWITARSGGYPAFPDLHPKNVFPPFFRAIRAFFLLDNPSMVIKLIFSDT